MTSTIEHSAGTVVILGTGGTIAGASSVAGDNVGYTAAQRSVADLLAAGYAGPVEFDPVGELVELLGYDGVWRDTKGVADAWIDRPAPGPARSSGRAGPDHFRAAAAGIRKSHASSHSGSAG